jgi:hypothetical protein
MTVLLLEWKDDGEERLWSAELYNEGRERVVACVAWGSEGRECMMRMSVSFYGAGGGTSLTMRQISVDPRAGRRNLAIAEHAIAIYFRTRLGPLGLRAVAAPTQPVPEGAEDFAARICKEHEAELALRDARIRKLEERVNAEMAVRNTACDHAGNMQKEVLELRGLLGMATHRLAKGGKR